MARKTFGAPHGARVSLHSVTVTHDGAERPVLDGIDLRFEAGITVLVGQNGSGKTTLLRVVEGGIQPVAGCVLVEPRGAVLAFVPAQSHEAVDGHLVDFARSADGTARALHGRLSLRPDDLDRWDSLSPGERRRWQIGSALAREPDVLLLDEPEGHVDRGGRELVARSLLAFRGIALVVTHDRALIDALGAPILRVHDGKAATYAPPYAEARRAWVAERAELEARHGRATAEVRAVAARLDTARRRAEAARRGVSARARMKGPRDHDGRSALAKGKAATAAARAGREAHLVRAAFERASAAVPVIRRDATRGSPVFVRTSPSPSVSPVLAHLDAPVLLAGGEPVLRDVRLTLRRNDRVRIVGENGAGKSTLVRALMDAAVAKDEVTHVPQEIRAIELGALLASLASVTPAARRRILAVVDALGCDPARFTREPLEGALSPGEVKKLALACALGSGTSALVLDEPTNHLDLPSIERLERALELYRGALVLVTHDDAFAASCTHGVILVEGGRVR